MSKIFTPKFRVSFPNVFKEDDNGKYSMAMLFDKKAIAADPKQSKLWADLKAHIEKAAMDKWGELPPNMPFRKGEEKEYDGYGEGVIFINGKSNDRPGLVGADGQPIMAASDFYGGCYAHATINAYAWDYKGKKGVSVGLQNIQKLGDGESFGGGKSKAEDDFGAIDTASVGGADAGLFE